MYCSKKTLFLLIWIGIIISLVMAVQDSTLTCTKERLPTHDHTTYTYAQWPASDECKTSYEFECKKGYELTLVRRCKLQNSKECEAPTLNCAKISCPTPWVIEKFNITANYTGTLYLDKATYKCPDDQPYLVSGSLEKTCMEDKDWTYDDPECSSDAPTTTSNPNITTTAPANVTNATVTTVSPAVAVGYEPVYQAEEYEAVDSPDGAIIGFTCIPLMLSPVIFIVVIDIIQMASSLTTKAKKKIAKNRNKSSYDEMATSTSDV